MDPREVWAGAGLIEAPSLHGHKGRAEGIDAFARHHALREPPLPQILRCEALLRTAFATA